MSPDNLTRLLTDMLDSAKDKDLDMDALGGALIGCGAAMLIQRGQTVEQVKALLDLAFDFCGSRVKNA